MRTVAVWTRPPSDFLSGFERCGVAVPETALRAGVEEALDDGISDAARTPGNDGVLTREIDFVHTFGRSIVALSAGGMRMGSQQRAPKMATSPPMPMPHLHPSDSLIRGVKSGASR